MHPTDDGALLLQYVETRSDEAFAALVAKHVNWAYAVAGALLAIRFARERSISLLGTCGGFQHAVVEYARLNN